MFDNVDHPTLRQLLPGTRVIYRVPLFQRDYAWTRDQWDDLWRDLEELAAAFAAGDGAARHYMGYLVLKPEDGRGLSGEGTVRVIDGQQRLATLSILMLACAEQFARLAASGEETETNKKREAEVRDASIGHLDLVTRRPVRRLFLNRNDDAFFSEFVLPGRFPVSFLRRKPSNQRLWQALEFFRGKLIRAGQSGEEVARLASAANDGLVFTALSVSDELNAYQVFETLNARGMRLSQGDIIKNFLFQKAEEGRRTKEMDWLWRDMESEAGGAEIADFFRCVWNSQHPFARREELYRKLRGEIGGAEAAFAFVTGAQRQADIYHKLQYPLDWRREKAERDAIDALTFAFGAREHLPLLLAAYDPDGGAGKMRGANFRQLLELVEIFHFRRGVISKASSLELEEVYGDAALAWRGASDGEELEKARDVLTEADVTEEQFRSDFADAEFDATHLVESRIVRHILGKLEAKQGGGDLHRATVEHVLPRRAGEEWDVFFPPDERDRFVRRLGNYCLLSEEDNSRADNRPYAEKRFIYANSAYRTARECGEQHMEWTPAALEDRQGRMAALAAEIWRL